MPSSKQQREEVLNSKIGELLIARHPRWNVGNVHIEEKGVIRGRPAWAPDILIEGRGRQPVVIEAKRQENSAEDVVKRVEERLKSIVDGSGESIEAGVAIVYPKQVQAHELERATFQFAVTQVGNEGILER